MAFTIPVQLDISKGAKNITSDPIDANGEKSDIFALQKKSGLNWGQVTIQPVLNTVTTFTADLEVDLSGTDANFIALVAGLDMTKALVLNLTGGNARYRFNTKSWNGTSAILWACEG